MANGVTDRGFIRPRLPEIRQQIVDQLRDNLSAEGFPDDIEIRPDSLMGVMIDTFADREAALWEVAEGVYYAMYPNTATGASLDQSVSFAGVERLQAEPSQSFVALYGDVNTVVPAGSQIRNRSTNNLWQLTDDVTITPTAVIDVEIGVVSVANEDYTVTVDGTPYTYSNTGDRQDILNGLESELSGLPMALDNNGARLRITSNVNEFP